MRRGDPARAAARRPDARRTRGARPAGADAAARRPARARVDAAGDLVPLEEQDRARWDGGEPSPKGCRLLDSALRRGRPGPYQLQAAIAACHATAASAADDRWARSPPSTGELARLMPLPGGGAEPGRRRRHGRGPAAGLRLLEASTRRRAGRYHLLPATRADLLRRLGRRRRRPRRTARRSRSPPPTPNAAT